MFDFSPVQILIVLVIALVVFGPNKLPSVARSAGRSAREFRESITGAFDTDDQQPTTTVATTVHQEGPNQRTDVTHRPSDASGS